MLMLQITVSDQGVPVKSTTVRVIVKVLDENDNKPQFMEKVYKIKLPERESQRKSVHSGEIPCIVLSLLIEMRGKTLRFPTASRDGDEQGKFLH